MLSDKEAVSENRSAHAPTLEFHEIQATVLRPRPAPYFGTHVLLRVDDAQAGRIPSPAHTLYRFCHNWWIAANTWLDIGISYAGLEALGVPQEFAA